MEGPFRLAPPPSGRELLRRVRLLDLVAGRFDRRVTLVVAGPGFGKTRLLAQAVDENRLSPRGRDVWLSCAPADSDERALAHGLLAALGAGPSNAASGEAPARLVTEAVLALAPERVALVLDDVHEIASGSSGARLLASLLATLPENASLLVAARRAPDLGIAKLVAEGRALAVDESRLCFDDDELREFAESRCVEADALKWTSGWPALAELAATSGATAWDFVTQEVLSGLDERRQRLLILATALGTLDAELAEALTGERVDLAPLLGPVPLVDRSVDGEYRPHPLWQELLAGTIAGSDLDDSMRLAARLLLDRGSLDRAYDLAVRAGSSDGVRRALRVAADRAHLPAVTHVARRWLERLPEELAGEPEGLMLEALVRRGDQPALGRDLLERAATLFRERGDLDGEAMALVHVGRIYLWQRDVPRYMTVLERAAALEAEGLERASHLLALGRAAADAMFGDGRSVLAELAECDEAVLGPQWAPVLSYLRASGQLALGVLRAAVASADEALASRVPGIHLPATGVRLAATTLLGDVDRSLAESRALVDGGLASAHDDADSVHVRAVAILTAAHREAVHGDPGVAAQWLERGRAMVATVGIDPNLSWRVAVVEALLAVRAGDEERAAAIVATPGALPPPRQEMTVIALLSAFPLEYVLRPDRRAHWDERDLSAPFAAGREQLRAFVGVRSGDLRAARSVRWDPATRPPLLPVPWLVELAVAAWSSGVEEAQETLQRLGSLAEPGLGRLAEGDRPIAAAARDAIRTIPVRPDTALALHALGPLEIHREGAPLDHPDLRRARVRELLGFLVTRRSARRAEVEAALWPDLDAPAASRNLRVTLSYVQRVLEPDRQAGAAPFFLRQRGDQLLLVEDPLLTFDVDAFDSAVEEAEQRDAGGTPSAALERYLDALGDYRGPYLADLDAEWLELERNRLLARFVGASIRAGNLLVASGRPDHALRIGRRAVEEEPWSEPARRLLASAYLASGDQAAARRALDDLDGVLRELGRGREEATERLAARLGHRAVTD